MTRAENLEGMVELIAAITKMVTTFLRPKRPRFIKRAKPQTKRIAFFLIKPKADLLKGKTEGFYLFSLVVDADPVFFPEVQPSIQNTDFV